MDSKKYLQVGGSIVAQSDSETDLVNLAASYDSDYEILDWNELSEDQQKDITAINSMKND